MKKRGKRKEIQHTFKNILRNITNGNNLRKQFVMSKVKKVQKLPKVCMTVEKSIKKAISLMKLMFM